MFEQSRIIMAYLLLVVISLLMGCQSDNTTWGSSCNPWTKFMAHPDTMKFIASGDPQYQADQIIQNHITVRNADWIAAKVEQKICQEGYLGYLIAGDLTFYSQKSELEKYISSIQSFKEYVFDGLGNHDFKFIDPKPLNKASVKWGNFSLASQISPKRTHWVSDCFEIWDEVRNRKRIPKVNSSHPNIHYSFDWNDLHLIHLNLFPGIGPVHFKPAQHPFNSIEFLKNDLATQVGNSGRPIVLIHHYGFDDFSLGIEEGLYSEKAEWWTENDRDTYWEILKPYNVAAIFTGHAHTYEDWYLPWDGRKIGAENVGKNFIPTFVAGAAREGHYLDCTLVGDTMEVKRFNLDTLLDVKRIYVQRNP